MDHHWVASWQANQTGEIFSPRGYSLAWVTKTTRKMKLGKCYSPHQGLNFKSSKIVSHTLTRETLISTYVILVIKFGWVVKYVHDLHLLISGKYSTLNRFENGLLKKVIKLLLSWFWPANLN